jgi:transcriptional regulator with XRE-family HTH domain
MVDAKGDPMNGALSKIEKGLTKQPAFETIAAIAEALDVGLEWLAYGKGDAPAAGAPERAVAEYVRKRLREIDRKGLMLSDIADQLGVDRGMVRRAVGGIGIGDKSLPKWARALGFGSIEGLRGAALEWWRRRTRAGRTRRGGPPCTRRRSTPRRAPGRRSGGLASARRAGCDSRPRRSGGGS